MKMVKNKDNKAVVRSSFMVAYFETLVLSSETEQRHVPYAVGVMKFWRATWKGRLCTGKPFYIIGSDSSYLVSSSH